MKKSDKNIIVIGNFDDYEVKRIQEELNVKRMESGEKEIMGREWVKEVKGIERM